MDLFAPIPPIAGQSTHIAYGMKLSIAQGNYLSAVFDRACVGLNLPHVFPLVSKIGACLSRVGKDLRFARLLAPQRLPTYHHRHTKHHSGSHHRRSHGTPSFPERGCYEILPKKRS